jgi:hypothetical protein
MGTPGLKDVRGPGEAAIGESLLKCFGYDVRRHPWKRREAPASGGAAAVENAVDSAAIQIKEHLP